MEPDCGWQRPAWLQGGDTAITKFSTEAGVGIVWENPGLDVRTSMALIAAGKLEHALTATSTLKQAATGLWKANDIADGLYTFSIGLVRAFRNSSVNRTSRYVQVDTFQNRPPTAATKKNDVAVVTAITTKF